MSNININFVLMFIKQNHNNIYMIKYDFDLNICKTYRSENLEINY